MTAEKFSPTLAFSHTLAYEAACEGIIKKFIIDRNQSSLITEFLKYAIDLESRVGVKGLRQNYVDSFISKLETSLTEHSGQLLSIQLKSRRVGHSYSGEMESFYKKEIQISRNDLSNIIISKWEKSQPYYPKELSTELDAPPSPLMLIRLPSPADSKSSSSDKRSPVTQVNAQPAQPKPFETPVAIDSKGSPGDVTKSLDAKAKVESEKKKKQPEPRSWGHFFVSGVTSDIEKVVFGASASATIATIWLIGAAAAGHQNRDFVQPISKAGDFFVDNADPFIISAAVLGGVYFIGRALYSYYLADKEKAASNNLANNENNAPTATANSPESEEEQPLLTSPTPAYGSTSES